jgi:hypothetical protein
MIDSIDCEPKTMDRIPYFDTQTSKFVEQRSPLQKAAANSINPNRSNLPQSYLPHSIPKTDSPEKNPHVNAYEEPVDGQVTRRRVFH